MNLLHKRHEIFGSIDMLVHAFQRFTRDRLEPDAEHRAAAFGREFEHAVILRKLGGNAGLPLDATSSQGTHDLLWALRRSEEIGIVDRDGARTAILHLMDNFVDRTITELEAVHQRFATEDAALRPSTTGLAKRLVH